MSWPNWRQLFYFCKNLRGNSGEWVASREIPPLALLRGQSWVRQLLRRVGEELGEDGVGEEETGVRQAEAIGFH